MEETPEGVQLYEYEQGEKEAIIELEIAAAEGEVDVAPVHVVADENLTWKERVCLN